ncbi:MAG: hypothetical protein AAB071_06840 [Bacteroidota bacterium]
MNVQVVTNTSGKKTAVLIPYEVWENFQTKFQKIQNKLKVMEGIRGGISEIKKAKKEGKQLQSLEDFLNEC